MNEPPTTSREDRLNQVLAAYVSARDAGRPLDRRALLNEHPDLAGDLASFFADYDDVDQIAGGARQAIDAAFDHAAETLPPSGAAEGRCALAEPTPGVDGSSAADAGPTQSADLRRSAAGPARSFGDFDLVEEIARGGMGVVYKARQRSLNRTVAVKMVLAGQFARPDDVLRFRVEAEAAAQLQHPGIVAIHQVGDIDGQQYFVMDFVDGPSLAALVRDHPLPPQAAAEIVRAVAEAIHYAHSKGILHRDLQSRENPSRASVAAGLRRRLVKESPP